MYGLKAPADYTITYVADYFAPFGLPLWKQDSFGTDIAWPGDGKNAQPPGKPGEGGNGGVISANTDVSQYALYGGGKCGPIGRDGYYLGGSPGFPNNAIRYQIDDWGIGRNVKELGRHTSKKGKDAKVVYAKKPCGEPGATKCEGNPYSWLNPILLKKLINHANDDYLGNRINLAESRMKSYVDILDEYMSDESWGDISDTERHELRQIYNELQLLLHRIKNNLD